MTQSHPLTVNNKRRSPEIRVSSNKLNNLRQVISSTFSRFACALSPSNNNDASFIPHIPVAIITSRLFFLNFPLNRCQKKAFRHPSSSSHWSTPVPKSIICSMPPKASLTGFRLWSVRGGRIKVGPSVKTHQSHCQIWAVHKGIQPRHCLSFYFALSSCFHWATFFQTSGQIRSFGAYGRRLYSSLIPMCQPMIIPEPAHTRGTSHVAINHCIYCIAIFKKVFRSIHLLNYKPVCLGAICTSES